MGLLLHYPLTEDGVNKGIASGATLNPNFEASGIVGNNCLLTTSTGTYDSTLPISKWNILTTDISMSCWVKFNKAEIAAVVEGLSYDSASSKTAATGVVIGSGSYGGMAIHWKTNNILSSGTLSNIYLFGYIRAVNSSGGSAAASTGDVSISFDTWYHVSLIYNRSSNLFKIYVSALSGSTQTKQASGIRNTAVSLTNLTTRYFRINASEVYGGNGPSSRIPFRINDVRLYDHALSNKEVYDLSKGLMVHFKMNSDSIGVTTNIDQCKSAMINKSLSNFANGNGCATATFGNYYGYECFQIKMYKESITAWTGVYLNFNPLSYGASVGDTVIRSCWMYVPSGQTTPGHFIESIEGNSTGKTYKQYDLTKCNTWQRIWLKGTIADTEKNNYLHYFMAMSSGSVDFTFYIRDFQAEINSSITQYTSGTRTEGDISVGLHNIEATPYGSITINNDSIIGQNSVSFEGTTSFLELPNFKPKLPNEPYTIAFWVYSREDKTRDVYFGNHANSSQTFNIERTASNYLRIYYNSDTPIGVISTIEIPGSEWVHIAIAFDGTTFYAYKNGGEKKYSKALSTTLNCTNTTYRIGSDYRSAQTTSEATRFNGLMTDFRIYATCLSENDIKSIYSTRKTIDRFGSICVTEVEEDETIASSQVLSNGVQKTPYISEIIELDDGSKWIQIMHHDNKNATNLFSSSDEVLNKSVFKNSDCWCDFPLINEIGLYDSKYEFFLVQEKYNGKFTRYRWSQTVNPITATFDNTKYNSSGITQIENMPSTYGGMYKSATGKTFFNMNNNTSGNWYGAIGCYTAWSQTISGTSYAGIPGFADSDSAIAVGVVDLWMRIDPANARYRELRGGVILTNKIYEE